MDDCIPVSETRGPNQTVPPWQHFRFANVTSGSNVNDEGDVASGSSYVNESSRHDVLEAVEMVLYTRVAAVICVAGLIGNALNMTVLTRRRLQAGMTSVERTVYLGLAALALSDMMFCACALPHAWFPPQRFHFRSAGFEFYYNVYSEAVINTFVMSSTWLTVAMAMSRYVAICHPLRARCLISGCRAKISIVAIFLLCTLCNLPRFWNKAPDSMPCQNGATFYFSIPGVFGRLETAKNTYMCIYFVLASVLPFVLLSFCNSRLVAALRQSLGLREPGHPGHTVGSATGGQADTHRTSLTLIIIVVMYMTLVLPAEVTNFLRLVPVIASPRWTATFNVILAVLNVMQASNFAFHFVLYCVVNVHFRHSMRSAFVCDRKRKDIGITLQDCEQAMALTNGGEPTTGATIM